MIKMGNLVQTLAFILPIIASSLVLCVLCVNIYFKIRRKFPINVNCWFCNEWTKVHYDSYNSFICPACLQYNGFNQAGDYNRILPEQHDELLNQQVPLIQKNNAFKLSNGLCHICNNNQKLKIYQLANFVPLNEDMFDVEVEHFQKQLEKAYKLCPRCEQVVKNVVATQNKWLLGIKLNNLKTKGLSLLDLNRSTSSLSKTSKQSYFLYFLNLMLILFATLILIIAFTNMSLNPNFLNKQSVSYVLSYLSPIANFMNNSGLAYTFPKDLNFNIQLDDYLNSSILGFDSIIHSNVTTLTNFSNIDITALKSLYLNKPNTNLLCAVGMLFQITSMFFNNNGLYRNIKQLLLWAWLLGMTWYQYIDELPLGSYVLQILISTCIIYTFVSNSYNHKPIKKTQTRKKNSNILAGNTCTYKNDLFDQEEDITSNFFSNEYGSVVNSTLKSKQYHNEIDTAESDCSFESLRSKYTSIHNPFKEPPPRIRSPAGSIKSDHIFGKLPSFQCQLTSSPVPFKDISNRQRDLESVSFIRSGSVDKNNISFKDLCHTNNQLFICNKKPHNSNSSFASTFDLNASLDNLHLGKRNINMNTARKVPIKLLKNSITRPILSPPKFVCVGHSSWLSENNSWKNFKDTNYESANFSSSSSQSSGFISQTNEYPELKLFSTFLPQKRNSLNDCSSLTSEIPPFPDKLNVCGDNQSLWREDVKESLGINETKHLFKPIQNNIIDSKPPCQKIHNVNASLGQFTPYMYNLT